MRLDTPMVLQINEGIEPHASMYIDDCWMKQNNESGTATVRLYNLDRTYMVLANRQDESILDAEALERDNIGIITRKRGGGALLIGREDFVISVSIGQGLFREGDKGLRVFLMFNDIAKKAVAEFGIEVEKVREGCHHPMFRTSACFHSLDRGEMIDKDGRKVFGGDYTGQPHKTGYFQYGFFPLSHDHERAPDYIKEPIAPITVPTGLSDYGITFNELAAAFVEVMYREYPQWQP